MNKTTSRKRILILGGTTEANELANSLAQDPHFDVITSRAGVTKTRKAVSGKERIGGFGGVKRLKEYLREHQIVAVIDATHPFAQAMTVNAFTACQDMVIPHIVLSRPKWLQTGEDNWIKVQSLESAIDYLQAIKKPLRIFVTTGQKELNNFTRISHHHYLARMIEAPDINPLPLNLEVLFERGPFSLENEIKLLHNHKIDIIVSKNSGGNATVAKLHAARKLDLPIVMISRPILPAAQIAESLAEVHSWLSDHGKTLQN